jgi:pimeloyl-ACP methyl ester carboxylesterase
VLLIFLVNSFAASPGEDMPYPSHFINTKGSSIGPTLLFMHGNPSSCCLWRNVVAINRIGKWLEKSKQPKLLLFATPGALVSAEGAIGRNILSWYLRWIK